MLIPAFREAGICSGTPLGAEDDVQGEAVRTFSATRWGSGDEELSGTQLNIQDGQAAQVSQEYASRHLQTMLKRGLYAAHLLKLFLVIAMRAKTTNTTK